MLPIESPAEPSLRVGVPWHQARRLSKLGRSGAQVALGDECVAQGKPCINEIWLQPYNFAILSDGTFQITLLLEDFSQTEVRAKCVRSELRSYTKLRDRSCGVTLFFEGKS